VPYIAAFADLLYQFLIEQEARPKRQSESLAEAQLGQNLAWLINVN
jgi:hypothetical protein